MKKFVIHTADGREFPVVAATRERAELMVKQSTWFRVSIVSTREVK